MAEQSGFFNAHLVDGEYDRVYLAEQFAKYFASFIGNGVFGGKSNELMVKEKEVPSMGVRVLTGQAWIDGYWYENTDELPLAIDIADGVLNRIDSIVVRWHNSERTIRIVVKKGTAATSPVAPTVQRDNDYYELKLADIYIKAGTTRITQVNITDKRYNSDVCGFVAGVVQQLDPDEFGIQLDKFISEFIADNEEWERNFRIEFADWSRIFKNNEEAWFKILKRNSENTVNGLINELNQIIADNDLANLNRTISSALETIGYIRKNMIPYPYSETSKDEYGLTWYDNRDGTIVLNGDTTSNAWFMLKSNLEEHDPLTLQPGEYILSGGTEDCFLQVYSVNGTTVGSLIAENKYQQTNFSISKATNVLVQIAVQAGASFSNLTIKPMLCSAKFSDGAWGPYAPSVKERLDSMAIEDDYDIGCFYRINKQTGRKEWINPTCAPGWEYALTERWNNKPVYQMTFSTASLPVNSAMVIETLANWDKIVSVSGYAIDADDLTSYPFPVTLHSQVTPIAVISRIEGDGSLVITTNGDASRFQAYITVKYTKDE